MEIPDFSGRSLAELFGLSGRVAMITGAGRGFGRAISSRLAEAGCAVAVTDLDLEAATAVCEEIRAAGHDAIPVVLDVRGEADWGRAIAEVETRLGVPDILVNNAGIYPRDEGLGTTIEQWDLVMDINLRGAFIGSKLAAERMVAAGKPGVLLSISSTCGERIVHGEGLHYPASKAGVAMLVRMLGVELKGSGIRSVGIGPGLGETDGAHETLDADFLEQAVGTAPLGRLMVPDDVARVAVFLVSDLAAMVNSEVVIVDGGRRT
jgi:NAD(P)-dependent dehydrogenase (short-subunit alcohol dehydrogenase family)